MMFFLSPDNPLLRTISEKIKREELSQEDTQLLIDQLISHAKGEQGNLQKRVLVGLAAPQVGISKRIILVDLAADGKGRSGDLRIYVNPEIQWVSQETNRWYESCFSTGSVAGIVTRPSEISVEAWDRFGQPLVEKHQGYIARIFQHEIDHLNGIRFPMRITSLEDLHWLEASDFPKYRNQEQWRHWPHSCSWSKWLDIIK